MGTDRDEMDRRLGSLVRETTLTGGINSGSPNVIEAYAMDLHAEGSYFAAAILFAIAKALREELEE